MIAKLDFFENYIKQASDKINFSNEYLTLTDKVYKKFCKIKNSNNKIIFLGNGGSAAISSHVSVDLTKMAK